MFLLYNGSASCAGRIIKNGAGLLRDPHRWISHRRGSWLACRREMLQKRYKMIDRSARSFGELGPSPRPQI
jgi:hypothetical protein